MNTKIILSLLCISMMFSSNISAAKKEPPEVTVDGLHRVANTHMALVYAQPGADLSRYDRIYLLPAKVAFVKNWLKSQNSIPDQTVRKEDMERIKADLANLFNEAFKQELQNNGGYVLVEGVAEDVLLVHPAIVDLRVNSPDTPGTRNQRSAIESVGSMTLYMELIDSVTGDVLVKAMDNKYDRTRVRAYERNETRNEAAATEMLAEWAKLLRKALDEARTN